MVKIQNIDLEHRTPEHRAQKIQTQKPTTYNIEYKNIKHVTLNITINNIRTFESVRKHQKILETIFIEFDSGKNKYVIVNPVYRSRNDSIKLFHKYLKLFLTKQQY